MNRKIVLGALAALALAMSGASQAQPQPTGADAQIFVDPVSARSATISPDGNYVAYIAHDDTGDQLVVADLAAGRARGVQTISAGGGSFNWVVWKGNDRLVMGVSIRQRLQGRAATGTRINSSDINYDIDRVIGLDRDGGNVVQMFQNQMRMLVWGRGSTFLLDTLPTEPDHVLIAAWDNQGTGAWRADVRSGRVERVTNGADNTWYYAADGTGRTVIRVDALSDGSGYRIFRRPASGGSWIFAREARRAEAALNSPDFEIIGPGPGANQVYVLARPDNQDFSSLYMFDTSTGELGSALQQVSDADASAPWINGQTRALMATCAFAQRLSCRASDPAMQRNLNALDAFFERAATVQLVDMSADGGKWLLYVNGPREPGGFYIYEVTERRVSPLVAIYPNLDPTALSPMNVVNYRGRDGSNLWAYVTAKEGVTGPRPMVVMPHGGPEARDYYGYDSYTQFLAARGYVVVQPNFRGGVGFGRSFAASGHGQWGQRMQDDVTDAVRHMIDSGVADPQRICIVGASYGGYAALAGAALTPDLYKCAISISGVTDLRDILHTEAGAGRASSNYQYWIRSIGDPRTNGAAIDAVSPRQQVARITAPVLLAHGEEDYVVRIRQSELMQQALNGAGKQTRLIRFEDEGHNWDDWSTEHRLTLYRETAAFIDQHIGQGR